MVEPLMEKHPRTLLVVIAEAAIERLLIADAKRLGALGYTVYECHGGGIAGDREGAWELDRSISLNFICTSEVAERIADHILRQYSKNYAISMYVHEVGVFRAEKF
jgi:nitrogen regulatory protein P-II 2